MKNYTQKIDIDTVKGTVTAFKVNNDVDGNPRWVIHYLDLFEKYENNERLEHGLRKYTARWFGGGYVLTSYNIKQSIQDIAERMVKNEKK